MITPTLSALVIQSNVGGEETPWWVLLIVLGGLLVLFIALLAGRRKKKAAPVDQPAAWQPNARSGYAEARWLSDNLTESLAIWHGDADFEGREPAGATDAANTQVWNQIEMRKKRATDELYAVEAAAKPGTPALLASQRTIAAVNDTCAAVTERSDARKAYRSAGGSESPDREAVAAARDREVRASGKVAEAREELSAALRELAPIT